MTEAEVNQIDDKLEHLADAVKELKDFIRDEIKQLKTEQIADLRKENERLADDQRRLWEVVRSLENDRNRGHERGRIVSGLMTAIISIAGSSGVAVFLTKWLK